jgi:hypothetical protein
VEDWFTSAAHVSAVDLTLRNLLEKDPEPRGKPGESFGKWKVWKVFSIIFKIWLTRLKVGFIIPLREGGELRFNRGLSETLKISREN